MRTKSLAFYGSVLIICFCVGLVIWGFWAKYQIEKYHKQGLAKTSNCSAGGCGNPGGLYLDYIMEIDGKKYKGSAAFLTSELSFTDCREQFIGKTFPAVYNPDYPSVSQILIAPKHFARFNYSFPDSLKWVKQYIKD